jgi:hypothetical protein
MTLPSFTLSKKGCLLPLIPEPILVQTIAIFHNFLKKWEHFNSSFGCKMVTCFFNKKSSLLIISFFFVVTSYAQTTTTYAVNIAGNQVSVSNYNFEWSVGESVAITTMGNSNLLVTNGLLQYNVENQPEINLIASFLPNEIKVYPNPVKNLLDINILHANKGKHVMELFDAKGIKIKEVQLVYDGMGNLESWNLSGLPVGQYILNIRQMHPVSGRLVKKGAYKIQKVN